MQVDVEVVRVFTRGDDGGNLLGIVALRDDLDDEGMQAVAKAVGYSETIFIDVDESASPVSVRIFTPAKEIPFAGHPLVGAAWWLHQGGGREQTELRTLVTTVRTTASAEAASVTVDPGHPVTRKDADELTWLGAARGWVVAMPWPYHVYEFRSPQAVADLSPLDDDYPDEVLAFARLGATRAKSRFFAPSAGVPEDAATGSAAVALAAAMQHEGQRRGSLLIGQGDEIGEPSTIHLEWDDDGVTIAGTVVAEPPRSIVIS